MEEKSRNKVRKERKLHKNEWMMLLVIFTLTAASIVFSILCINGTEIILIRNHRTWTVILSVALLFGAYGCCIWFILTQKTTLLKTFLSAYVFLLLCLIFIFVFQQTGFFKVVNSPEKLQEYLEKAGIWMPIFYIVLQYLQVVLLPIPSLVSTLAGIALFGPFKTMIYSLLGILLGSFTAFYIGRKLGNKAVVWMVGEETLSKWQKKLKGKDNLFLTIMFILPLFPDDILCFIAGLSSMSTRYFIVMIFIARLLGIAGTCYSIDLIPFNTWWGLLIWGMFFVGIIIIFFIVYIKMDVIQAWLKNKKRKRSKKG